MLTLLVVLVLLVCGGPILLIIVGDKGKFQRSTWKFLRESGLHLRTLHGYIYARWTQQYVNALFRATTGSPTTAKGEFWLAKHYHGKVLTHEHARCIVNLDQSIVRRDLDQVVPFPVARDLILQAPPDIVAYECVCRNGRPNHCEPTQVCMVVGQPFTDMVIEHHPEKSRRLSRGEALQLLEGEHRRGHVHSAWFKDAMMNRFYAICNCCKCCCGGIREMVDRGVPMITSSGYLAEVDPENCIACGECVESCPFEAMTQEDGRVSRNWDRCMGCGVCEIKCEVGAVAMVRDERKGVPLDVRLLA